MIVLSKSPPTLFEMGSAKSKVLRSFLAVEIQVSDTKRIKE